MNKLISMVDFVLSIPTSTEIGHDYQEDCNVIRNYANFLKQPLKLEMFVCVDDDGNVLERQHCESSEDCECDSCLYEYHAIGDEVTEYEQAKEKVLFEGFTILDKNSHKILFFPNGYSKDFANFKDAFKGGTIGNYEPFDLTLTQSAKNIIGI